LIHPIIPYISLWVKSKAASLTGCFINLIKSRAQEANNLETGFVIRLQFLIKKIRLKWRELI
jgi:hypothetical protein